MNKRSTINITINIGIISFLVVLLMDGGGFMSVLGGGGKSGAGKINVWFITFVSGEIGDSGYTGGRLGGELGGKIGGGCGCG